MLKGVCENTGNQIYGWPRVKQSIKRIVQSYMGSYIGMRPFGSYVPDLIDEPQNPLYIGLLIAAISQAISRFEPEFLIEEFEILAMGADGKIHINIAGFYKAIDNEELSPQSMEMIL